MQVTQFSLTEHGPWLFCTNSLSITPNPALAKLSRWDWVEVPGHPGSNLAFQVKCLEGKPNTRPRKNLIRKQFIFVWVCYIGYQDPSQMFKIAELLKTCWMLLYGKAFSKTIIMSTHRVSALTRRISKWLKPCSQRKVINVHLRPGGHWKQAIPGLGLFNILQPGSG